MSGPLRVLLDARMLIGRFSGVARFVTRLVDHLAGQNGIRVVALCGDRPYAPWVGRDDIDLLITDFCRSDRSATSRFRWERRRLRDWICRANVDVYHATWNTGVPTHCPVPAVLTIHDLIPWDQPTRWPDLISVLGLATGFGSRRNGLPLDGGRVRLLERYCYRHALRASARRARLITTVSDYVRDRVESTLRVAPSRLVTVANGVDPPNRMPADACSDRTGDRAQPACISHRSVASDSRRQPTPAVVSAQPPTSFPCSLDPMMPAPHRPYVLYVGGHERRKNVAGALRAMRRYWNEHGSVLGFHLTGRPEALSAEARTVYEGLPAGLPVRWLGDVDDTELARQYAGARALLFLSQNEGFGLPVVEAMAHGCPVVAARRAALPEVAGVAGLLVDPDDLDGIASAISAVVDDAGPRDELIRKGLRRARDFTWARTAARMREVYEQTAQAGA